MKFTKRHLITLFVVIVIAFFLASYKLPYYIYKPGGADALNPVVNVEDGFQSEGDLHLVTVSGLQATPIQYVWAKLLNHHEVVPLHQVRPEGVTEEQYMQAQLQMMENSQQKSTVVAYEAADADITVTFDGVYVVNVIKNMPADGKLKMGDLITEIDGQQIQEADDLIDYLDGMEQGDTVSLEVERDGETLTEEVTLQSFDEEDKVGVGIQLVTDRDVDVNPEVTFSSGKIGGPSAGLMLSLEIYDQLTEDDLTKGHQIAGTGEIDYEGNVKRIGGIDKKVVAADKEGCDIFFAPYEQGKKNSNYEVAKRTAEEIDTDMEIIPVDTFDDALEYLQNEI
ncbi:MAG TPA: SepM family pheromone-processing serine protease [Bacillota bacterium]|nr:SepM family pheromone-processing serine protease [Bacillota bacterium]